MEYQVIKIDKTESTNNDLKDMAKHGQSDQTVLIAKSQSNGHGKEGSSFSSPDGGLYMSILYRRPLPASFDNLTLDVGEIVKTAIFNITGLNTDIKIPNDLLYKGKKLVGILVESFSTENEICIVIGIGINVNSIVSDFDSKLEDIVTTIKSITGKDTDIDKLAEEILKQMKGVKQLW